MHLCACTRPCARVPTCTHALASTHTQTNNSCSHCFSTARMICEHASILLYTYVCPLTWSVLILITRFSITRGFPRKQVSHFIETDCTSAKHISTKWMNGLSHATHQLFLWRSESVIVWIRSRKTIMWLYITNWGGGEYGDDIDRRISVTAEEKW